MGWWSKWVLWIYLVWQISLPAKGLKMQVTNIKSSPKVPTIVSKTNSIVPSTNNINAATLDFNKLNHPENSYQIINAPNILPNINYNNMQGVQANFNKRNLDVILNYDNALNDLKIASNQQMINVPETISNYNYDNIPINQNMLNGINRDSSFYPENYKKAIVSPLRNVVYSNILQENDIDFMDPRLPINLLQKEENLAANNNLKLNRNVNKNINLLKTPTTSPFSKLFRNLVLSENHNDLYSPQVEIYNENFIENRNQLNPCSLITNFDVNDKEITLIDINNLFTADLFQPSHFGLDTKQTPINIYNNVSPISTQPNIDWANKIDHQINRLQQPIIETQFNKDVFSNAIAKNILNTQANVLNSPELNIAFESLTNEDSKPFNMFPEFTNTVLNAPSYSLPSNQIHNTEAITFPHTTIIKNANSITSDHDFLKQALETESNVNPSFPNKKQLTPNSVISNLMSSTDKFSYNLPFNPFEAIRPPPLSIEQKNVGNIASAETVQTKPQERVATNILKSDVTIIPNTEYAPVNRFPLPNQYNDFNSATQTYETQSLGPVISSPNYITPLNINYFRTLPNLHNLNVVDTPTSTLSIQQSTKNAQNNVISELFNQEGVLFETQTTGPSILSACSSPFDESNEILNTLPINISPLSVAFPVPSPLDEINLFKNNPKDSNISSFYTNSGILPNRLINNINTPHISLPNLFYNTQYSSKQDNTESSYLTLANLENGSPSTALPDVLITGNQFIQSSANDVTNTKEVFNPNLLNLNSLNLNSVSPKFDFTSGFANGNPSQVQRATNILNKQDTLPLLNRPLNCIKPQPQTVGSFSDLVNISPKLSDVNLQAFNQVAQSHQLNSDFLNKPDLPTLLSNPFKIENLLHAESASNKKNEETKYMSNKEKEFFLSSVLPQQATTAAFPMVPAISNTLSNSLRLWPFGNLNSSQRQPTIDLINNPGIVNSFAMPQNPISPIAEIQNNIFETYSLESDAANALALEEIMSCTDNLGTLNLDSDLQSEINLSQDQPIQPGLPPINPDVSLQPFTPLNFLNPQITSLPYVNPVNILSSQAIINYAKKNGVLNTISDLYKVPATNYQQVPLYPHINELLSGSSNSINDAASIATQKALSSISKQLHSKKPPQYFPVTYLPPVNPYLPNYPYYSPPILDYTTPWSWLYSTSDQSQQQTPSNSYLFEGFEVPDTLADISFDDFPDLLTNFPDFAEYDDNFKADMEPFMPYMSSLTVNVLPVIEDKRIDNLSHFSSNNFFDISNFSPSYLPNVNMPVYQTPQIIDVQALTGKNKGHNGKDLARVIRLLALSELLNRNECDADDLEALIALMYVS